MAPLPGLPAAYLGIGQPTAPAQDLLRSNPPPAGVVNEKNTRGKLKSTVERLVGRKGVTILDSINNIKVGAHVVGAWHEGTRGTPARHQGKGGERCKLGQ